MTRTDVSQSESRLAASRSTLAGAEGALEISREAYRRRSARCRATSSRCRRCRRCPPSLRRGRPRSASSATRGSSRRSSPSASAVYDFDRALAAKGPTLSVHRLASASSAATRPAHGWDGDAFGEVGLEGSMPLYTGGRNDSLVRQAQALLDQRRFELQDEARAVTQEVGGGLVAARGGARLDRRPARAGRGGAHRRRGRRRGGAARRPLDARRARRRPGAAAGRGRGRAGAARRVRRGLRRSCRRWACSRSST